MKAFELKTMKFMEMLVITQTSCESGEAVIASADSSLASSVALSVDEFSLDDILLNFKFTKHHKLEDEARQVLEQLFKFHGSDHISISWWLDGRHFHKKGQIRGWKGRW